MEHAVRKQADGGARWRAVDAGTGAGARWSGSSLPTCLMTAGQAASGRRARLESAYSWPAQDACAALSGHK